MRKIPAPKLRKITRLFNKYRVPECRARVIKNAEEELKVEFTGSVAPFACCFDEHFVDYLYLIEEHGDSKFRIKEIKRDLPDRFVVTYSRFGEEGGIK